MVANIALTVGGTPGAGQGFAADLGPLDDLNLTVGESLLAALALALVRVGCQFVSVRIAAGISADLIAQIRETLSTTTPRPPGRSSRDARRPRSRTCWSGTSAGRPAGSG